MAGAIFVLLVIVTAELMIRDGLTPLHDLGGAASGQYKLR